MKIHFKNIIVSSLSVLVVYSSHCQTIVPFESTDYQVEYNTNNGRITGDYVSKYSNGATKASGQLINGYKYGDWRIFDAEGTLVIHRLYISPFEFTQISPATTSDRSTYTIEYNNEGFIPYFEFQQ